MADSGARQKSYHHGETIRAFRSEHGLTQAQLAERWPGGAVNPQYVQRVEAGKKHIADQEVLRQLAALLSIPLWRFGLSVYDPFAPHNLPGVGVHMYTETLDAVECLIQQTWTLRRAALLPSADESLRRLNTIFTHFSDELPPPTRLETRYLRLAAQAQRLNAVTCVERREYRAALTAYTKMRVTAQQLGDPATLALAEMSIGAELERAGRADDAVEWLERARDTAFGASKYVAAFVHSYLARAYASAGTRTRFERAVETARTLASGLGTRYGDGTDFVYARGGSVLAEQSWGYLRLGAPEKTLALRDAINRQIEVDGDRRLHAWIPLDWARAHLLLGEVESAITNACEFSRRVTAMRSPHALRQARRFASEAARDGYGDVPAVRDFRDALSATVAFRESYHPEP
jgi:transcriptional regulator with XRE-family HTH domain